jgi:protein-S-isoprenylcysteine O-methyltransferase Ste14
MNPYPIIPTRSSFIAINLLSQQTVPSSVTGTNVLVDPIRLARLATVGMKRFTVLLYGVISYVIFFATFLYAIGFTGNLVVPKSVDSGRAGSLTEALLVNTVLLAAFALQHSVMARAPFKRALTRIIPEAAERSTYVLASSVALIALFYLWRPVGITVWQIDHPAGQAAMYALFALGAAIVLVSTFLINHFDLFGLRQVWLCFRGRTYTHLPFATPFFYRYVRHPLYFGWLLFFWFTPVMTAAHLFFAVMTTAYILVAIRLEERDLIHAHGETYRRYRQQVPMILPIGRGQTGLHGESEPRRETIPV